MRWRSWKRDHIHKIASYSELNILFMDQNHTEQLICIACQQLVYF